VKHLFPIGQLLHSSLKFKGSLLEVITLFGGYRNCLHSYEECVRSEEGTCSLHPTVVCSVKL